MTINISREDSHKLWVRTSFPVTHNVFAYWMKEIAPQFSIDDCLRDHFEKTHGWPDQGSLERWESRSYRYLHRRTNPDKTGKFVLTDGERGNYWTILEFPDDQRQGFKVSDTGLVYCPHPAQVKYLDHLQDLFVLSNDFSYDLGFFERLVRIAQDERSMLQDLKAKVQLPLLTDTWEVSQERLRYDAMKNHSIFLSVFNPGQIPLQPEGNSTIFMQTKYDFFRRLDSLIAECPDTQSIGPDHKRMINEALFSRGSEIDYLIKRELPEI